MAIKVIGVGSTGTILVKAGGGRLYDVIGIAPGTSMTYTLKDGPDPNGNFQTLFGSTPIPVVAGQNLLQQSQPVTFRDGLSVVVGGTAGEIEVQYD